MCRAEGAVVYPAVREVHRAAWRNGVSKDGTRFVPEEVPIALTYSGGSQAVMMATPQDLEDFAIGFSLNEGLVERVADIENLEIIHQDQGIELRMWLAEPAASRVIARRRVLAGPTGCGLCGIESISEAVRPVPKVASGICARGRWTPQCDRQAQWCLGAGEAFDTSRLRSPDEPRFGRDGTESRDDRCVGPRLNVRAHGAGRTNGRRGRNHPHRGCA